MALRLTIENMPSLPDGGPVSYTLTGKRGIDIGRDQYLDWVLPDPNRVVSGKHCEIRYRDGGYWLRDVSTNGTFVNRSERRMQEQHQLRSGDRVEIGHYIINVFLDGEDGAGVEESAGNGEPVSLWSPHGEAASPVDSRSLRAPRTPQPSQAYDALDWAAAIPEPVRPLMPAAPPPPQQPPSFERAPSPPPADDLWGGPAPAQVDSWSAASIPSPPPRRTSNPPSPQLRPVQEPPPSAPAAFQPPEPAPLPRAAPPPPPPPDELTPALAPLTPPSPHAFQTAPPPSAAPPPSLPPASLPPASLPPVAPPPPRAPAQGSSDVLRRFAMGAGISESALASRDPGELAEQLGAMMRIVATNVSQLLLARAESKGAMRSSNQTLIQAADNNPLRFSPSAEDALAIMFGRQTKSYLDGRAALEQSFAAIKTHQVDTFAAVQQAIQQLVAELDPKEIEKALDAAKGSSLFSNKKARLWDDYVIRWKMKAGRSETGLLGAFMLLFADAYDKRRAK